MGEGRQVLVQWAVSTSTYRSNKYFNKQRSMTWVFFSFLAKFLQNMKTNILSFHGRRVVCKVFTNLKVNQVNSAQVKFILLKIIFVFTKALKCINSFQFSCCKSTEHGAQVVLSMYTKDKTLNKSLFIGSVQRTINGGL